MKYQFHKMHGCGNDFLIYDQMRDDDPEAFRKHEVQYLCDRNFGLGADGLVVLGKGGSKTHSKWVFWNCDGSIAEMCGNAARCAIQYLTDRYFPNEEVISIETAAGTIKGKLNKDLGGVEVTLFTSADVQLKVDEKILRSDDEVIRCFCINTGVPHAVIEVSDIFKYPISRFGKLVMFHPTFQPEMTNVTFFQKKMGSHIWATTFERGVERETFACGTGAAAAALVYSELYMQPLPVTVEMPGGILTVDQSPLAKRILLRGDVEYVGEMHVASLAEDFSPVLPFEVRGK